jgi:hypothetical protein
MSIFKGGFEKTTVERVVLIILVLVLGVIYLLLAVPHSYTQPAPFIPVVPGVEDAATANSLFPGLLKDTGAGQVRMVTILNNRNNTLTYLLSATQQQNAADSYNIYKKYFADNGWKIALSPKDATMAYDQKFSASNGTSTLTFEAKSSPTLGNGPVLPANISIRLVQNLTSPTVKK